jgi:hypothetical protein
MYGDKFEYHTLEGGNVIFARKGQNKIFELAIDTVDAEWTPQEFEVLMGYECPEHLQQWSVFETGVSPVPTYVGSIHKLFKDPLWDEYPIGTVWAEKPRKPNWGNGFRSGKSFEEGFSSFRDLSMTVLRFYSKTHNGLSSGVEYTVYFHRDGTVRIGGHQDGSGKGPDTREEAPRAWEFLEAYGLEVVTEARPITRFEQERKVFYDSVADHKPSPEREKELLSWLYSQGWNVFEVTEIVGVVEVPITSVSHDDSSDHSDMAIALVEVFDPTCINEWKYRSAMLHSSLSWGPGCRLMGNIPEQKGFQRTDRHNSKHDERWRLAGFGKDHAEAESVRQRWHEIDKIAGTGAILVVTHRSVANIVGR